MGKIFLVSSTNEAVHHKISQDWGQREYIKTSKKNKLTHRQTNNSKGFELLNGNPGG